MGDLFSDRLTSALQLIEDHPRLHGTVWQDVRAVRLRQFQYVMYYVASENRTDVLAVIYGAREDATWKSRREGVAER